MKKNNCGATLNATCFGIFMIAVFSFDGCAAAPTPLKHGVNTFYYGYISNGRKFGVSVGENRSSARDELQSSGLRYDGEGVCGLSERKILDCKIGQKYDLYRKRDIIRNGQVYIIFEGNTVEAIAWILNYGPDI